MSAADPMNREDWLWAGEPAVMADEGTQRALASAWLADALLEHASIASFAQTTLKLLALGAPSDLIADSQRAALDEVEHAKIVSAWLRATPERRSAPVLSTSAKRWGR